MPQTPDGRVHLFPASVAEPQGLYRYQPDPATATYPLSLISPASEHTISSTLGELRPGIARLKIHPDDAHGRSIGEGDASASSTISATSIARQRHAGNPAGHGLAAKGLWARSTFNGATANALVPDTLTDIAGGACFNDARVQVELLARH